MMRVLKDKHIIIGVSLILILSHLDDSFKNDSSKWVSIGGYVSNSVRYDSWLITNVMAIKLVLSLMLVFSTLKMSLANWVVKLYLSWQVFDLATYLWYGKHTPFNTFEMQAFILCTFFVPIIIYMLKSK